MAPASKMNAATSAALADDGVRQRLAVEGYRLVGRSGARRGSRRQAGHQAGFEQMALEIGLARRFSGDGECGQLAVHLVAQCLELLGDSAPTLLSR